MIFPLPSGFFQNENQAKIVPVVLKLTYYKLFFPGMAKNHNLQE